MSDMISFNTEELASIKPVPHKNEIPVYKLVSEDHTGLYEPAVNFDFTNPPLNANSFASSLVETCKKYGGFGLSANQCGFNYRVFVAGANDAYVAYFNPKITNYSKKSIHLTEGCLTYTNLFLNITRPESITIEYQDFLGENKEMTVSGVTARVILHEMDHMDGIVFTYRAKTLALKSGYDKRDKMFKKLERASKTLTKAAKGRK